MDNQWKYRAVFGTVMRKVKFYENEKVLSSMNSELMQKTFGELKEIDGYDALKKYGIDVLEEASEKMYKTL